MERVLLMNNQEGDDLIVSFAIEDTEPEETKSLILLRTPKYESVFEDHERGVCVSQCFSRKKEAILEPLLAKAISLGADQLEVEYKDRYEEVFAMKSGFGLGIASFRSSSPEAQLLLSDLYALAKKKQRVEIDEHTYELRARIFDSFGEDAFRVELRRL